MLDMSRPRPPHLQRGTSRHGRKYWFVQLRYGSRKIRLRNPDGSDAVFGADGFEDIYKAAIALAGEAIAKEPFASRGTLKWAWLLYTSPDNAAWSILSEATRKQRQNIMKHVLKSAGESPLEDIDADAMAEGVQRRAKTPSQAKNFKQTMNQFFAWLKREKIVNTNPAEDVELPKRPKTGGFKEWTEDDIQKYEKRWPLGTRQRIALNVYMYTGLRRGDAADVGPKDISKQTVIEPDPETGKMVPVVKEVIAWATEKSQRQTVVHLPVLPPLRESLDAGPTGDTFIISEHGRKYVKESLGNLFKGWCVAAGVLDKSAHGLRKAAATRAADNGATAHELMAIFGWKDIKEAEIYTKAADRKRLAMRAIGMLQNTDRTPKHSP